jgi:hypothetical protein
MGAPKIDLCAPTAPLRHSPDSSACATISAFCTTGLEEERKADAALTKLAKSEVNQNALAA